MGPHLTQVSWAKGYLNTKWHLDASSRLATIEMGRKLGRALLAPFVEGLGPHVTESRLPGLRPTPVPSTMLIHPAVWP